MNPCVNPSSPALCLVLLSSLGMASAAAADTDQAPVAQSVIPMRIDSGWVQNTGHARGAAYTTVVRVPGRAWIRLKLEDASLGRTPRGGEPTVVRVTSILDGAAQTLTANALTQWSNTSAYFNGDAVLIEVIADPNAAASRLVLAHVTCGANLTPGEGGAANLCMGEDDRVQSNEPANGRIMPLGCTAWIFNDPNHTMLTAGHCQPEGENVVQFNVPLSDPNGVATNPPPEHQYAVDASSIQFTSGFEGDDWCYFGCFANPNTGLTPFQAQEASYTLSSAPPLDEPAQSLRVTGYGTVEGPVSPTLNLVQKSLDGPMAGLTGTTLTYVIDTTGGNSGSPVVDVKSGNAIGIHTHGGCSAFGGANIGTAVQHPGLQYALSNPIGVCVPQPLLQFTFPDGLPEGLDPAGDSIRVVVSPGKDGPPAPGTGMLFFDAGAGFTSVAMVEVRPNEYDAVFPPIPCATSVSYYFSALTTNDTQVNMPLLAPQATYAAVSANEIAPALQDSFEIDLGWTVTNDPTLTSGAWQRVTPTATGPRVPPQDADGSGQCYVTDDAQGEDIDGGSTTLTSPPFDASQADVRLRYWRWFSSSSISGEDT
ncbi:MAG: hypothetical protein JNK53_05905, partial [Phycisphaerae bacterium]|nr:hypothetical protein [Phycisphaerae bacterium]